MKRRTKNTILHIIGGLFMGASIFILCGAAGASDLEAEYATMEWLMTRIGISIGCAIIGFILLKLRFTRFHGLKFSLDF